MTSKKWALHWLFCKVMGIYLPYFVQVLSHTWLLLDTPICLHLAPSSSLIFRNFTLHSNSSCIIPFTLDISLSFKYSRRILFLSLFTNWIGVDRRAHTTHHLQEQFMISNFKALHLLRLLNMSSQELLLPPHLLHHPCVRHALGLLGICYLPAAPSLPPAPWKSPPRTELWKT